MPSDSTPHPDSTTRKFDWFAWMSRDDESRLYLHKVRDGAAFTEIQPLLLKAGYEFGDIIFNLEDRPSEHEDLSPCAELLVMTTRPPLDDTEEDKHPIPRTGSRLETQTLGAVRPFFGTCMRSYVRISDKLCSRIRWIDPVTNNRTAIHYRTYRTHRAGDPLWATYLSLGIRGQAVDDATSKRTAGYLVYVPRLPESPALLVVFGMSGNDTLLWCRLLRQRLSSVVVEILGSKKAHFVMVELIPHESLMRGPELWTARGLSSIAAGWDTQILVNEAIDLPALAP